MNFTHTNYGCSKISITPPFKVPLAGFTFRTGDFTDIHSPIWAKANYFYYPSGDEIIVICADLIWFDFQFTEKLKAQIQEQLSKPNLQILFHATHTHYAPHINPNISPLLGHCNQEYIQFLSVQLITLCQKAVESAELISATLHTGTTSIPINRRVVSNGIAEMKPNPDGINDNTLSVLVFKNSLDEIKSMFVHLACHPTSSAENRLSAEFITNAVEALSLEYPNLPIISVFQGFCGDTRINVSKNNEFYRGQLDNESKYFQDVLHNEIKTVLQTTGIPVQFQDALQLQYLQTELPLGDTPNHNTFIPQNEVQEYWLDYFTKNPHPTHITTKLWYWQLATNVSFLFSDGEIVTEYNMYAKSLCDHHLLNCGMTNGIVSYIPTAQQIPQKGLEAYDSLFFFMLPYAYAPEVESTFKSAINTIISKLR